VIGTVGPAAGRGRPGRPTVAAALLVVLVLLGAAAAAILVPGSPPAAKAAPRDAAPAAGTGRITFAGTEHRSLGRVSGTESSVPLFGPGPAHFDTQSSARGDLLVFTSLRDEPRPQVYLRDAAGGIRKLTTGRDAGHPELAPDRRSVVFDSAEPTGPGGAVRHDLWSVGVDGSGLRRLTDTPADEISPTLSPDGSRLAYSTDADPALGRQIRTRAVAGGPETRISHAPAGNATEPAWNPVNDAAHRDLVAFTLDTGPDTGPRLWLTDGSPGSDRALLGGGPGGWRTESARWLPDGNGLLFLSPDQNCGCDPFANVYRVENRPDAAPELVLKENRAVDSPTWLGPPDNGTVVVTRATAAASHTATLQDARPDGSDPRDLGLEILKEDPEADTNTNPALDPLFVPRAGYDPWTERQNYTPDGGRIVLTRFEGGAERRIERIWLADADGGNAARLPLAERGDNDWDTDPTFSPDGTRLAFTRTSPGGVGPASGPGRILVADVATGAIVARIEPPAGQPTGSDAQPTWSSDGSTIAFTRTAVIDGNGGNKHVWTVPVNALDRQRDLSSAICPAGCQVIDDSPAFSPDGRSLAFNRKDGGGRVNERSGIVVTAPSGGDCRVVLPAGLRDDPTACRRELPDTTATGPFQPRDVAWSPDASRLLLSSRRTVEPNSPEGLSTLDLASGVLTPFANALPGRQKEPGYQQSVDLGLTAPAGVAPIEVGSSVSLTATVTNHGPAASPGTTFTVDAPPGLRLDSLTGPAGSCPPGSPQCDLGILAPGASVRVSARLIAVTTGDQQVGWSVAGAVVDPNPGDNAADTTIPVVAVPPPSTSPPPTSPPASPPPTTTPPNPPPPPPPASTPPPPTSPRPSTPPPKTPPAPPAPPVAGPALTVTAQPNPGFVGGRVVLTYTVRNGRNALATGLRVNLGLPTEIPAEPLPGGCRAGVCALGDLAPGATSVVRVVLAPNRALRTTVDATLTTTGTDADPADNVAHLPLDIRQPRIVAVPNVGKPGFVTSVRGVDFPPGAPVTLTWTPGITAAATPPAAGADFRFVAQLLILVKDSTGPRTITASGPGFAPVTTPFLVVAGSIGPPDEVSRR
jgi:Tol biopolymer transport system component